MSIPWLVPAVWAVGMVAWRHFHRRDLERIRRVPNRITVGGTRGKTTVTRLITAALESDGSSVAARTAGRIPESKTAGGEWLEIERVGPPDLDELRRWLKAVVHRSPPQHLVIENHAITPESMWAINAHVCPPTLAVVTDAVPDHLDLWPSDPVRIAELHLNSIRRRVPVVTGDSQIAETAVKQGRDLIELIALPDDTDLPSWMVDHLRVALTAVQHLSGEVSAEAIERAHAAALALLPRPVSLSGGAEFLDLFDANDPISAARAMGENGFSTCGEKSIAIFANRTERPWRRRMFKHWMAEAFAEVIDLTESNIGGTADQLQSAAAETHFVGLGNAVGPAQGFLRTLRGG